MQHRKLTLLGKITAVQSLALSKLVHLLTSLPNLNKSRLNKLNTMFFKFTWNGTSSRIKRNTLFGDTTHGGLKMIYNFFCSYLKINRTKRKVEILDGYLQKTFMFNLKIYGGIRLFPFQKEKNGGCIASIQSFLGRCFIKHL